MITLELTPDKQRIAVSSDLELRDGDRIKQVPGARYDQPTNCWTVPRTWAICRTLRGVFGDELVIKDQLVEWATAERRDRIDPAVAMRSAWDADGDADLYPFQRSGVKFLAFARQGLLCDEMGTGKTIQTIRLWAELVRQGENPFPVIVVCPNNMVYTWEKEIHKWYPGLKVGVVKGTPAKKRQVVADQSSHVVVVNFEAVRSLSRLMYYPGVRLKRCSVCDKTLPDIPANSQSKCEHCRRDLNLRSWKTVVVDEAHRLKDPRAKQTRAVWALRTPETEFAYGLTGTAIADNPIDLWPILHMLSPEEWPSRTKYVDRYCLASFNIFGGMTIIGLREDTKQEFFDIVDPRMRRMPKEAVLPWLPKKTYSTRYLEMQPKQAKAYKQMEDGMAAIVDGAVVVAGNEMVQVGRLSQFASSYGEVDDEGHVTMAMPSNKVDALVELLDEMGEAPAVVFAVSRQLIELAAQKLAAEKISYSMIVGGQTAEQREVEKSLFQDGKRRVVLCTIQAGGIGITLTRAGTAVFLQRSWSNIDNSQAEDRVHRIGSEVHDKIEIIDLVSVGTIEEVQREVLYGKAERLEELMRDRQTIARLAMAAAKTGDTDGDH